MTRKALLEFKESFGPGHHKFDVSQIDCPVCGKGLYWQVFGGGAACYHCNIDWRKQELYIYHSLLARIVGKSD